MASDSERKAAARARFKLAKVDSLFVTLPPEHRREPVYLGYAALAKVPADVAKAHYALAAALAGAIEQPGPVKGAKR